MPPRSDRLHIALLVLNLEGGGVQARQLLLAQTLASKKHQVDLLVGNPSGPLMDHIPSEVNLVRLRKSPSWLARALPFVANAGAAATLFEPLLLRRKISGQLRFLFDLARYLRREKPDALIAGKIYTNLTAIWARRLAGVPTRVVITERNNITQALDRAAPDDERPSDRLSLLRRVYPAADRIVAVSDGLADDLSKVSGIRRDRIDVVYNPIVTGDLAQKAASPVDHPWFQPGSPPVLVAVGRLTKQKDYPTMLAAFSEVRRRTPVRLMIFGEGAQRATLERETRELGVESDVVFAGWVANPYPYMARAAALVMSSAWEGLPAVLVEALACGCPVVSTDCPNGPAEILEGDRYGKLVPVGDSAALAKAILETIAAEPDRDRLKARAEAFTAEKAAEHYISLIVADGEAS